MMTLRRVAAGGIALIVLLAGCSSVVDGSGTVVGPHGTSGSGSGRFPSASGAPSGAPTSGASSSPSPAVPSPAAPGSDAPGAITPCPHVRYPFAHLAYDCITAGLTQVTTDEVWPLQQVKRVEATGWVLEEGAGHWGAANGKSLGAIALAVRRQMLDADDYLASPKVVTDADKDITVNGAKAHLLQTTITIDPAAARKRGTKVKQEKLWIVAVQVGRDDVSLWHASVPDLVKNYWAAVPALINTIKVI